MQKTGARPKKKTRIQGAWEQLIEENISAYEGESNRM
jgi:hypothetical protein